MYVKQNSMYCVEDDILLWKYMSFSKFVNLLSVNLYFHRIDSFEDIFECHYPDIIKSALVASVC